MGEAAWMEFPSHTINHARPRLEARGTAISIIAHGAPIPADGKIQECFQRNGNGVVTYGEAMEHDADFFDVLCMLAGAEAKDIVRGPSPA